MARDIEIFVLGEALDLLPEEVIETSYAIGSLLEFGGVSVDGTNSFKVPPTDRNRRILRYPQVTTQDFNDFRVYLPAVLVQDGVTVGGDARVVIENATEKEIEIAVYSGNIALTSLIPTSQTLRDLTTQIVPDYIWNLDTWQNNANGSHPLVDWGGLTQGQANTTFPIQFAYFVADVRSLFKAIVEENTGLQVVANDWFLNNQLFNQMVLPFHSDEIFAVAASSQDFRVERGSDLLIEPGPETFIPFDVTVTDRSGNWNGTRYTCTAEWRGRLRCEGGFDGVPGGQTYNVEITSSTRGILAQDSVSLPSNTPGLIQVVTDILNFSVGEVLSVTIDVRGTRDSLWLEGSFFENEIVDTGGIGSTIQTRPSLPEVFQIDLLSYVLTVFDLLAEVSLDDQGTPQITFVPSKDVSVITEDWTDLVDQSVSPTIQHHFNEFNQVNTFAYANDENVRFDLGQGDFKVNDSTLNPQSVVYTAPFSASEEPGTKIANNDIALVDRFDATGAQTFKASPRVMLRQPGNGSQVTLSDGIDTRNITSYSVCHFLNVVSGTNLSWNSIIQDNFGGIQNAVNEGYRITINLFLTPALLADFSFLKFRYLNFRIGNLFINGYFFVERIEGFRNDGSSTPITLIKVRP